MHSSLFHLNFFILLSVFVTGFGVSVLPAGVVTTDATEQDLSFDRESLLEDSESWPFYVKVDTEKAPEIPRAATLFPGVLLRVEGSQALIDFGRDGIHLLPLEATNFFEEAARVRSGEAELDLPNFTRYTTNIFICPDDAGRYRPLSLDLYASTPLYVLVYGDLRLIEDESLRTAVDAVFAAGTDKGAMGIVFPTTDQFYERAFNVKPGWTIPQAHTLRAFLRTLRHDPKDDAVVAVLVDAYGKILKRAEFPYPKASDGLMEYASYLEKSKMRQPEKVPAEFSEKKL